MKTRRHKAKGVGTGKHCEGIVLASQFGVTLTRAPLACRILPGGRAVKTPGPCDVFGTHHRSGRAIVLDAKESSEPLRLDTHEDHLPTHQREELLRHGRAGAIAGLMVESIVHARLFWVPWPMLVKRVASIGFDLMHEVGQNTIVARVHWDAIAGTCPLTYGGKLS